MIYLLRPDFVRGGRIPVLILPGGGSVYDSSYICDWLSAHHPDPPLGLETPAERLDIRKIEVLADGICDALVLMFLETQRAEDMRSQTWIDRQSRKVDGGIRELDRLVCGGGFVLGGRFSMADICVGSLLGYLALRWPDHPWRRQFPRLAALSERLEERPSFRGTRPAIQVLRDKVV